MSLERIEWQENDAVRSAFWRSENKSTAPKRIRVVDDSLKADLAFKLASEGTAMLWRGDYHNARQLLQAMARRSSRKAPKTSDDPAQTFHLHRQAQAQRARTLGMLLVEVDAAFQIPLRRAPDVREACMEVYDDGTGGFLVSLRELLGIIGAHEWRRNGVAIPSLSGDRIFPWYGVYSPIRGEYLDLLAKAPLPSGSTAIDVGTGTGVIAALLARRGVVNVIATDNQPRALACARENIQRLQVADKVDIVNADLFPGSQASLIVCNPPWIPARANAAIEHAIYDPDSRMLRAYLHGLKEHLLPGGEGWLILSDLAEHLHLRSRAELLQWIEDAGLAVRERHDTKPAHSKSRDASDPLHAARSRETTSLWRLVVR